MVGALEGLAGGAAAVTNAVLNAQHQHAAAEEEDEMKRHNSEMEKMAKSKQGLTLTGSGLKKPQKRRHKALK